MAMDLLGTAGMTNSMKQLYARALLERAKPNFVHMGYGRKDGIPRNGGRSIEWRRYERPSAATTALTEGTPPAETQLTVSNVQATVNQYGAFTRHSEALSLQNFDPYIGSVTEMYAEHLADTLDIVTRNVLIAGTTVQIASTVASRGAVGGTTAHRITFAEVRESLATLESNDAKPVVDNKFIGIIHPYTKHDLFGDSDIINSFQNAYTRGPDNPLASGEIGDFYGIRWLIPSNARVFGSQGASGGDVYATLIMGRGYYGEVDYEAGELGQRVIVKAIGSAGGMDPLDQMGTAGWKAALAVARLNENFAVRIEHTASLGDEGV